MGHRVIGMEDSTVPFDDNRLLRDQCGSQSVKAALNCFIRGKQLKAAIKTGLLIELLPAYSNKFMKKEHSFNKIF